MTASKRRFGWIMNLDAELELASSSYNPRPWREGSLEQFGGRSLELLGPRDVLVEPGVPLPEGLAGRAWCPTPRAVAALCAAGAPPEPHPPVDVLRAVNHRRFAAELGGGLPDQHYVEERSAIEAISLRAERPWLLKRPLAFAGRGQLRVYGAIGAKQWSWIDASLRRDGLIVEPLVSPTLELSLHGFIWKGAHHELGRICVQTVTDRGVFRGVRRAAPGELTDDEDRALVLHAERAAAALSAAGYFGPFGIDAYRYRTQHGTDFCAMSELNARYTMGFATGFPRPASELAHG
jgi:hypothetical protein